MNGERGTHSIGTTTSMTLGSVERGTHCTMLPNKQKKEDIKCLVLLTIWLELNRSTSRILF